MSFTAKKQWRQVLLVHPALATGRRCWVQEEEDPVSFGKAANFKSVETRLPISIIVSCEVFDFSRLTPHNLFIIFSKVLGLEPAGFLFGPEESDLPPESGGGASTQLKLSFQEYNLVKLEEILGKVVSPPSPTTTLNLRLGLHAAQISVFMVFCGPHLPLAFQCVCGPGGWRAAAGAAGYSTKSSFCWQGPLLETIICLFED